MQGQQQLRSCSQAFTYFLQNPTFAFQLAQELLEHTLHLFLVSSNNTEKKSTFAYNV